MKKFIIRENVFGTRKMFTKDSNFFELLFSKLYGPVVCASDLEREYKVKCSDYFTKDKQIIRGSIKIVYEITNPMKFSSEKNFDKVLDVVTRTVFSSYFSNLDLSSFDGSVNISSADILKLQNIINQLQMNYLNCITVKSIYKINIEKQDVVNNFDDAFVLINGREIKKRSDLVSGCYETYTPIETNLEDRLDSGTRNLYPRKVFVGKDEVLYYCGKITKKGFHHGKKARGNIVSTGKHVFSTSSELYCNQSNRHVVYPNIIYTVNDCVTYLDNYNYIRNLFNYLSSLIVQDIYDGKVTIIGGKYLYTNGNDVIKNTIDSIEENGVKLDAISITSKNPYVKENARVRKENGMNIISLQRS